MKRLKTSKMTAQENNWVPYVQGSDGGNFSKKVRFGDCDFLMVKLMKALIMKEKYNRGIKIGTLFRLG